MLQRNKSIDIAKGIGIITVVWGHLPNACPIKEEIYLFHMPLFFLISGYFYKDDAMPFVEFIKKKIKTYILPYFLFFIICLTVSTILYYTTGHSDLAYISPGIVIHPYGVVRPLWFFLSLFEVQTLYYIICKYATTEKIKNVLILICLTTALLMYRTNIQLPLYIGASLSMVAFLHIGRLLNKFSVLQSHLKKQIPIIIIGLLCYISAILLNIKVDVMVNELGHYFPLSFFAALGAIYAILNLSKYIEKIPLMPIALNYLGKNSLIIFALHILCFEIARYIFGFPTLENSTYADGIYITIFGIVGSLIIGYPIKKYVLTTKLFVYSPPKSKKTGTPYQ